MLHSYNMSYLTIKNNFLINSLFDKSPPALLFNSIPTPIYSIVNTS
ncbi:hypothetical protein BH11BAC5_BH11BAC5_37070 [soil metagenome]